MKVKKQPLEFINTRLLQSHIDFIIPPSKVYTDEELIEISNNYIVDIDFATQVVENDIIQVFMIANINNSNKPLPGYKIMCECICMFKLNKVGLNKEEILNLESYSTLNITLNTLRNYITDATSKFPLGMYLLPSIDLNDMIKQKKKKVIKKKQS